MKSVNILLISTLLGEGQGYTKHGIGIISSILRSNGHNTMILNNPLKVSTTLKTFRPDLVGIYCMSSSYDTAIQTGAVIRNFDLSIPIFVGGVAPTLSPMDFGIGKAAKAFDHVFLGEAEITFPEIVTRYGENGLLPSDRVITGRIVEDLDALPFVDRSGYKDGETKHSLLRSHPGPMYSMLNSRWCQKKCRFCAPASSILFGGKKKLRSVDNFIAEIKTLPKNSLLMIHDDNLIENEKWAAEFAEKFGEIARPFICQAYPAEIIRSEKLLEELVKVGLTGVMVGFESGSDRMLRYMRKGTNRQINEKAADVLHRLNIGIQANLMFGCPTETYEEMMETVTMYNERIYPAQASPAVYTPYPGSDWYDELLAGEMITIEDPGQYERSRETGNKIKGVDYKDVNRAISQLKSPHPSWLKYLRTPAKRIRNAVLAQSSK